MIQVISVLTRFDEVIFRLGAGCPGVGPTRATIPIDHGEYADLRLILPHLLPIRSRGSRLVLCTTQAEIMFSILFLMFSMFLVVECDVAV